MNSPSCSIVGLRKTGRRVADEVDPELAGDLGLGGRRAEPHQALLEALRLERAGERFLDDEDDAVAARPQDLADPDAVVGRPVGALGEEDDRPRVAHPPIIADGDPVRSTAAQRVDQRRDTGRRLRACTGRRADARTGPGHRLDLTGFVHRDSRDLTGFIDGTANPQLLDAPTAALVPDGQPGAGGSHVLAMRWVHDLDAFDRLPLDQQENVFGRTRPDSIEFMGARLPKSAHIARVQIDDPEGKEIQIYRRSVPYGRHASMA